jgi:hypothetical protein
MGIIKTDAAKMAEHDDVTTCGICFEPFKDGDVAVQAARWVGGVPLMAPQFVREKFWAHPVCLFSLAREAEGPASRVAAMPPEPPDDGEEALPEKRKPK